MTLQIEHREISFSSVHGDAGLPAARPFRSSARAVPEPGLPSSCPSCGAARILPLAVVLAGPGFTLELLRQSVAGRHIHLGQTPGGVWWVCRQSMRGQ